MSIRSKHGGSTKAIQVVNCDQDTISRMDRKRDFLKVAVEMSNGIRQLYDMDQNKTLKNIIIELSKNIPNAKASELALLWLDENTYITESNRDKVRAGAMLKLVTSPNVAVDSLLSQLRQNQSGNNVNTYKRLSMLSKDYTFAEEFMRKGGLQEIIKNIQNGSCMKESLAHALGAVLDLMDHGSMTWEELMSKEFITQIIKHASVLTEIDVTIHQHCLAILEGAIANSQRLYQLTKELNFSWKDVKPHLDKSSNPKLQLRAISVTNALMMRCPVEPKKVQTRKVTRHPSTTSIPEVSMKDIRQSILNNIIRSTTQVDSDMAHQLHVFQALTFNQFEEKMLSKVNPQDKEQRDNVLELSRLAFDNSESPSPISRKPLSSPSFNINDFKNLGFVNYNNPVLEFEETPPGLLALDCMKYFANHQQDSYIRLVLENSSHGNIHQCPFAKSSIHLVKIICELLKVGQAPTETGLEYFPIAFTHEFVIEEFYTIGIILLNKTWKEMSAISEDFDKVMDVVREQFTRALKTKPASMDQLKNKLQSISYGEIIRLRNIDRQDKEELFTNAKPVLELQKQIKPDIFDLIAQQRLNSMVHGAAFNRVSNKLHWYCRLSPNHKFLHYGDLEDTRHVPSFEELPNKVEISEIKEILTGRSCPHIKNARSMHKASPELAFSVSCDPNKFLNFMAADEETMQSALFRKDLEILLTMEMKLRLLDLERIPVHDQPPVQPPSPDNFNFALDF